MERERPEAHRFPEPPAGAALSPRAWGAVLPAMIAAASRHPEIRNRLPWHRRLRQRCREISWRRVRPLGHGPSPGWIVSRLLPSRRASPKPAGPAPAGL
jgi:hypothetical protein